MPNPSDGLPNPRTLAADFRSIRQAHDSAEHLYCFVYVAAWLELEQDGDVNAIIDRSARLYSEPDTNQSDRRPVWLRITDKLSKHIDDLIFDIVFATEPRQQGDSDVGPDALKLSLCDMYDDPAHAVALALADAIVGHPPRFPHWLDPRLVKTLSGRSDWVPRRLSQCFTAETWCKGEAFRFAN